MGFSTSNIEHVRAMAFPVGTAGNGIMLAVPGLILISWSSGMTDKLFQVYVDGQLSGVTSDPGQRKLLVQYEHNHTAAIEVVAVEPADKDVDYAGQLEGFTVVDGSHAIISWPKRGVLPLESQACVYGNAGSGAIDYSQPLVTEKVWAGQWEKWGWGLDAFGRGDFGYSGTAAVGWGRGSLGQGEFGFDAELQSFQSEALSAGTYSFAVRHSDGLGNYIAQNDTICEVSVDPLPAAPVLAIDGYDGQLDSLVLRIE